MDEYRVVMFTLFNPCGAYGARPKVALETNDYRYAVEFAKDLCKLYPYRKVAVQKAVQRIVWEEIPDPMYV